MMGNGKSKTKKGWQTELKTWALSQHMHLNHDQLLDLRDECLRSDPTSASPSSGSVSFSIDQIPQHVAATAILSRKHLKWALNQVLLGGDYNPDDEEQSLGALEFYNHRRRVILKKDYDVILDLYTIWDMFGTEEVPALNFVVSLAILAGQEDDTLRSVIELALDVYDVQEAGTVTAAELVKILQGLNSTIAVFGDTSLTQSQLHDLVHEVVEFGLQARANRPSKNNSTLPKQSVDIAFNHSDVVTILAGQPMLRKIMMQSSDANLKRRRKVSFSPDTKCYSGDSTTEDSKANTGSATSSLQSSLTPPKRILRVRFSPCTKAPDERANSPPTQQSQPNDDDDELDDDMSTCVSSMEGNHGVGISGLVWPSRESWDDLKSLAMDSISSSVSSFAAPYYKINQKKDLESGEEEATLPEDEDDDEEDEEDGMNVLHSSSSFENNFDCAHSPSSPEASSSAVPSSGWFVTGPWIQSWEDGDSEHVNQNITYRTSTSRKVITL